MAKANPVIRRISFILHSSNCFCIDVALVYEKPYVVHRPFLATPISSLHEEVDAYSRHIRSYNQLTSLTGARKFSFLPGASNRRAIVSNTFAMAVSSKPSSASRTRPIGTTFSRSTDSVQQWHRFVSWT